MLNILESFVQKRDYSYVRMDGATAIASRQPLVARFNTVSFISCSYFYKHILVLCTAFLSETLIVGNFFF